MGAKTKHARRGKKSAKASPAALGADERALLGRLAERTGLPPREVVARALSAYAAAVAPELQQPEAPGRGGKTIGRAPAKPASPRPRLFYSVDGAAEREVAGAEIFFGRDPACAVHLDLPLIADRHARVACADGRWLFEDLRSPRGSYKGGEQIQVAFLASGDEIDLGGFLPVRFRLG